MNQKSHHHNWLRSGEHIRVLVSHPDILENTHQTPILTSLQKWFRNELLELCGFFDQQRDTLCELESFLIGYNLRKIWKARFSALISYFYLRPVQQLFFDIGILRLSFMINSKDTHLHHHTENAIQPPAFFSPGISQAAQYRQINLNTIRNFLDSLLVENISIDEEINYFLKNFNKIPFLKSIFRHLAQKSKTNENTIYNLLFTLITQIVLNKSVQMPSECEQALNELIAHLNREIQINLEYFFDKKDLQEVGWKTDIQRIKSRVRSFLAIILAQIFIDYFLSRRTPKEQVLSKYLNRNIIIEDTDISMALLLKARHIYEAEGYSTNFQNILQKNGIFTQDRIANILHSIKNHISPQKYEKLFQCLGKEKPEPLFWDNLYKSLKKGTCQKNVPDVSIQHIFRKKWVQEDKIGLFCSKNIGQPPHYEGLNAYIIAVFFENKVSHYTEKAHISRQELFCELMELLLPAARMAVESELLERKIEQKAFQKIQQHIIALRHNIFNNLGILKDDTERLFRKISPYTFMNDNVMNILFNQLISEKLSPESPLAESLFVNGSMNILWAQMEILCERAHGSYSPIALNIHDLLQRMERWMWRSSTRCRLSLMADDVSCQNTTVLHDLYTVIFSLWHNSQKYSLPPGDSDYAVLWWDTESDYCLTFQNQGYLSDEIEDYLNGKSDLLPIRKDGNITEGLFSVQAKCIQQGWRTSCEQGNGEILITLHIPKQTLSLEQKD